MNESRAYHKTIKLDNGNILVVGGINSYANEKIGTYSSEIYITNNKKFKKINDTNLPHVYHSVFKLTDGNIVIADINGIEIFDIKTETFKLLKTKPTKRYAENDNYKFALFGDDYLLIIGGRIEAKTKQRGLVNLNKAEIIDIKNDKLISTFDIRGNGFGCITLPNKDLMIIGGIDSNKNKDYLLSDIYLLDHKNFVLNKWGNLQTPIVNPFVFINDNEIILIGGNIPDYYKKQYKDDYEYLYTKGSEKIYFINISDKTIKEKNIKEFLKDTDKNIILDVVKFKNNIYFILLKSLELHNFKVINISNLNEIKINNVLYPHRVFYSANIATNDGIIVTGGKLLYQEKTQYSFYDSQKPYAQEQYNVSSEGFIINDSIKLKIKIKGEKNE